MIPALLPILTLLTFLFFDSIGVNMKVKKPGFKHDESLKEKAVEIFKSMGYNVEYDRFFGKIKIDVFLKKKILLDNYESWFCFFYDNNEKLQIDEINRLLPIVKIVKEEFAKQYTIYHDLQAMVITKNGFTEEALAEARKYCIELNTIELLLKHKEEFMKNEEKLKKKMKKFLMKKENKDGNKILKN
jgi:hypothetical protein